MKFGYFCPLSTSIIVNYGRRACKLVDMQKDMRETSDRKKKNENF